MSSRRREEKGIRIKNGHRQDFTQVEILSIGPKGAREERAAPKAEKKVIVAPVAEEP
ncbi:MAG: bL21 family ribosomal protein [Marinilabiliales bacterium]|nr:bL21 family ribosomal protein [Marinilabiliales bacterium]